MIMEAGVVWVYRGILRVITTFIYLYVYLTVTVHVTLFCGKQIETWGV